jgi:hypothetical protein
MAKKQVNNVTTEEKTGDNNIASNNSNSNNNSSYKNALNNKNLAWFWNCCDNDQRKHLEDAKINVREDNSVDLNGISLIYSCTIESIVKNGHDICYLGDGTFWIRPNYKFRRAILLDRIVGAK